MSQKLPANSNPPQGDSRYVCTDYSTEMNGQRPPSDANLLNQKKAMAGAGGDPSTVTLPKAPGQ